MSAAAHSAVRAMVEERRRAGQACLWCVGISRETLARRNRIKRRHGLTYAQMVASALALLERVLDEQVDRKEQATG